MSKVFETTTIKGMELSNRFVRSATWEGLALEDGSCTPALITMMTRLAEGRVGLIIPVHTYISPEGQAGPWQLGVHQEACINGLKEMTDLVHGQKCFKPARDGEGLYCVVEKQEKEKESANG